MITSDCWEVYSGEFVDPFTQELKHFKDYKTCNDTICCFATFRVCYKKIINPITFDEEAEFNNFTRLDTLPIIPRQCITPCFPNNCKLWAPFDTIKFAYPAEGRISNQIDDLPSGECEFLFDNTGNSNQSILKTLANRDLLLKIKCRETGSVNLSIFDILGNKVNEYVFFKKNFDMQVPVGMNYKPGIYLCIVKLNDRIYGYEKILLLP